MIKHIKILFEGQLFTQPCIKFAATNNGIEASIGALPKYDGIETTLSYKFLMTRADKPGILSITIGKQILITDYENDNYAITPTIGYGYFRWKDYSKYDAATVPTGVITTAGVDAPVAIIGEKIVANEEFKPVFGFEVGKDSFMGWVTLTAN